MLFVLNTVGIKENIINQKTMKKVSLALGLFVSILILASWTVFYNSGAPCDSPLVGGHTGAPGETSCAGCHAGTDNSGPASITFSIAGGVAQYTPGQVYSFTVSVSQPTIDKMGFACVALRNSNNSTIGSFQLLDAARTRTYTGGSRKYVSHTPCAADVVSLGFNEWSFNWQAPAANVGNITLYLGALAGNHDHATSGDFTYKRSITLTPAVAAGVDEWTEAKSLISIFPNPTDDKFEITSADGSKIQELQIMDLQGKVLKTLNVSDILPGTDDHYSAKQLGLRAGIYFLKITDEHQQSYKKLIVE